MEQLLTKCHFISVCIINSENEPATQWLMPLPTDLSLSFLVFIRQKLPSLCCEAGSEIKDASRFIAVVSLARPQTTFCTVFLFNTKQDVRTRNTRRKMEQVERDVRRACRCAWLRRRARCRAGDPSVAPPPQTLQASDTSPWTCAALTAFAGTSGSRGVLSSSSLPVTLSLHARTHMRGWQVGRTRTQKHQAKPGLICPFLSAKFLFTVPSCSCFMCGSNQEEQERERNYVHGSKRHPACRTNCRSKYERPH